MHLELHAYSPDWPRDFENEAEVLRGIFRYDLLAIHHIGSTAIPGMIAKPTIDILAVASTLGAVDCHADQMQAAGYIGKGENGIAGRRYFQRFGEGGRHTHHVHIFPKGSREIERHLAFRDFLRAQPAKAALYADAKLQAAEMAGSSRPAYQARKSPFVQRTEIEALAWHSKAFASDCFQAWD